MSSTLASDIAVHTSTVRRCLNTEGLKRSVAVHKPITEKRKQNRGKSELWRFLRGI